MPLTKTSPGSHLNSKRLISSPSTLLDRDHSIEVVMRIERLALIAVVAESSAFTLPYFPASKPHKQRIHALQAKPFISKNNVNPLNESDSDGRMARGIEKWRLQQYEDWRIKFGKGDFDPERYANFKTNYASLMEQNKAECDAARSQGKPDPIPRELDETGDCPADEYRNELKNSLQTLSSSEEEPNGGIDVDRDFLEEKSMTVSFQQVSA